jgi:SAM-dependent methyltransferase
MTELRASWDEVYSARSATEVSWYQREPAVSLRLIESCGWPASVIDVGAGASVFVDCLLDAGYMDLTLLDLSQRALDQVRERLGTAADSVAFVCGDLLHWTPTRTYDVWHDRAVLHFLTELPDRARYTETAAHAVRPGGHLVIGTFAEDGPTECSGRPVLRSSADDLVDMFAADFAPVHSEREEHVTPWGAGQPFTWVVLRRT